MSGTLSKQQKFHESYTLLQSLAEEIRLPLVHILRGSELALLTNDFQPATLENIKSKANAALTLVNSYMLGLEIADRQGSLELEPISINSVLYAVADELYDYSKQFNTPLELDLARNQTLVMAHKAGIEAAFLSLGYAFMEANQQIDSEHKPKSLKLVSKNTRKGVRAGIYGIEAITPGQLRSTCTWYGKFKQPLSNLSSSSAAGIYVAYQIIKSMTGELKTSRYHHQNGLMVGLHQSTQLSLV